LQTTYDLTKREKDVIKLLWKSDKPLTASEISKCSEIISISTVQTVLKSLVKKGFVEVADIVYSGTVLSRSYKTTISSRQYEMQKFVHSFKELVDKDFTTSSFVTTLLEREDNDKKALAELEELEKMIKKRKKELLDKKESTNVQKQE